MRDSCFAWPVQPPWFIKTNSHIVLVDFFYLQFLQLCFGRPVVLPRFFNNVVDTVLYRVVAVFIPFFWNKSSVTLV